METTGRRLPALCHQERLSDHFRLKLGNEYDGCRPLLILEPAKTAQIELITNTGKFFPIFPRFLKVGRIIRICHQAIPAEAGYTVLSITANRSQEE